MSLSQALFGEIWIKNTLKVINAFQCSKFCCIFTLRQGTIMIALIELSLTAFCLFLLLLSVTHAKDTVTLVSSDLLQLEENNLSEEVAEDPDPYIINNEKKMILGQHLAIFMTFLVWVGLLLAILNFIFCTFLLYGAIQNSPDFLLPWTSTGLVTLISVFFFIITMVFLPFRECKLGFFIILFVFFIMELYAWLIVFSYYQELKTWQLNAFGGITHQSKEAGQAAFAAYEIQYETC